ncbi:hypothetical protein I4U23_018687 [Adineta vaga]|nr:hypothetical protein I4U23_018687 [Adineta vaga]
MSLVNYFHYCLYLFILGSIQSLFAYSCYDCPLMHFDYSLTIDDFPSPTQNRCRIITAETGCYVRVSWYNNNVTEVFYGTNVKFPLDSVNIEIDRRVIISSGIYTTIKYVDYTCGSSNSTPCNTLDNLKRSFRAVKFSSEEHIDAYDTLIQPSENFDSSSCYEFQNMTDACPKTDPSNCNKCMIDIKYSQETVVCAVCPSDRTSYNFFLYQTKFILNNRTQLDSILVRCQQDRQCNSMTNVENIRRDIMTKFDYNQFFNSTASSMKLSLILSFVLVYIELFRLLYL